MKKSNEKDNKRVLPIEGYLTAEQSSDYNCDSDITSEQLSDMGMNHQFCKDVRRSLKLNQAEFGKLLGFSSPSVRISEIENNKVNVSNQVKASLKLILHLKGYGHRFI